MFGTAKKPVTTKRGIVIGGGYVHPEVVPHPRPGSEKTMKTLLREYERANGDALERMVIVGHPTLQIENERADTGAIGGVPRAEENPDEGAGNHFCHRRRGVCHHPWMLPVWAKDEAALAPNHEDRG